MAAEELLSKDQVSQLTLLSALRTDAAMTERIEKLLAVQAKIEETLAAVQAEREGISADGAEARRLRSEAVELKDAAERRGHELDAKEQGIRDVMATLKDEQANWSAVRTQVDGEHAARAAALTEREASVAERETALAHSELEAAENKAAAIRLRATYQAMHERLHAALVGNEAELDGA